MSKFCTRRLQSTRDYCEFRVQWFSSVILHAQLSALEIRRWVQTSLKHRRCGSTQHAAWLPTGSYDFGPYCPGVSCDLGIKLNLMLRLYETYGWSPACMNWGYVGSVVWPVESLYEITLLQCCVKCVLPVIQMYLFCDHMISEPVCVPYGFRKMHLRVYYKPGSILWSVVRVSKGP